MSNKIEFVLELTRAEAVALVFLNKSGFSGDTVVDTTIQDIAVSLQDADDSLDREQYYLWQELGNPQVELVGRSDEKE